MKFFKRYSPLAIFSSGLLALAYSPFAQATNSASDVGLLAKPAVVRIFTACQGSVQYGDYSYSYTPWFMGTGYFVSKDGYIVTNAHVVELAQSNLEKGKAVCRDHLVRNMIMEVTNVHLDGTSDEDISNIPQSKQEQARRVKEDAVPDENPIIKRAVILPDGESLEFVVEEPSNFVEEVSRDVAVIKVTPTGDAPTLAFEDLDSTSMKLQDEVTVVGYPAVADVRNTATFFRDNFETLESAGTKSSLGQASVIAGRVSNPFKTLSDNARLIQLDALSPSGSSGSPVINQDGKVVGMVTFSQIDSAGMGSIPFAIPADKILEFVNRSGSKYNEPSITDELYQEGLRLLDKKDYIGARNKFQAVKSNFPQHSEASRLIRESDEIIAEKWGERDFLPWLLGAVSALLALALISVLIRQRQLRSADGILFEDAALPERENASNGEARQNSRRASRTQASPWANVTQYFRPRTEVNRQPCIILKNPDEKEIKFLLVKDEHHIGRDPDWSDLNIPEQGWEVISRHHATLKRDGDSYLIYDGDGVTGSTNKTFVNGEPVPVERGVPLNDGDTCIIGQDVDKRVRMIYSKTVASRTGGQNGHVNSQN